MDGDEYERAEAGGGIGASSGGDLELNVRQARLHDLRGLVHKGRGDGAAARREFEQALSLDVNQLGARVQLED